MKKSRLKDNFLDELRKIPIVLVACEKVGLSRNSVYRWRNEDETFAQDMEKALKEGEEFVNDMSESQLLTLIKEKNWSAISFWLRHRNPKYKEKLEITTKTSGAPLTTEQEAVVREALKLAAFSSESNIIPNNSQNA